jgi:hypothetical protein
MPEEDIKISKHSSGVSIIIRLDQLWKNCFSYKRNGQYRKWNEELDSVWLELARDLKKDTDEDKDYSKLKEKFDKFDEEIIKIGQIQDEKPAGFEELPKDFNEKRNKHYKKIMEKQEFLSRIENKIGKGTSYDEEDDDWD